ncbi:MAG: hypothetical protein AAFQ87_04325 [Bacteroidota bacterium]
MKPISQLWTLLLLLSLSLFSCQREEIQALESLEGEWNVVAIESLYGAFTRTTGNATEIVEDAGQLGTMTFEEETVRFTFTRNDTLFSGTSDWELAYEKVRSGFFRVPQYTLTIDELGEFDVAFEDGTNNSQRNAESAEFRQNTIEPSERVLIFNLEKVQ